MAEYWNLYHDSGATETVSPEGDFTSPVEFELDIDAGEIKTDTLYLLAETGYLITDVKVRVEGTTADKWRLSSDGGTTWNDDEISLPNVGDTDTVSFMIEARAETTETVSNDTSVIIVCEGVAEAT